jgi:4-alpha-glucanotransferase
MSIMTHISCLPSRQGIGYFNEMALRFIDFLANAGISYWQICPLNPTSYGDKFEAVGIQNIPPDLSAQPDRVSFDELYKYFKNLLENFGSPWSEKFEKDTQFLKFQQTQAHWLRPDVLFASLKHFF